MVILAVISLATTLGLTSVGKSTNNDITELQGGMDPDASEVVFQTEDGERLSRGFYSSYNPIVIPEVPDKEGTTGKYWSLDGETIATEEDIRAAMTSGEQVVLNPIYTARIIVDADAFTIAGLGDSYYGIQTHVEANGIIGKSYTVEYTGAHSFLYWRDESNRIASTNGTYTFVLATNKILTGATANISSGKTEVFFVGSYYTILDESSYGAGVSPDDIIIPSPSSYVGYDFIGWTIDGNDYWLNSEISSVVAELIGTKQVIRVDAVYRERGNAKITIRFFEESLQTPFTGKDDIIALTGAGMFNYRLGDLPVGYSIEGWYLNGRKISQTSEASILVSNEDQQFELDVVLTVAEVIPEPIISIQTVYAACDSVGKKSIVYVPYFSVPKTVTVCERGVLYTNKDDVSLIRENIGSGVYKNSDTKNSGGTYSFTMTIKDTQVDKIRCFAAFLVYLDDEGEHIIYSDTTHTTYNTLVTAGAIH